MRSAVSLRVLLVDILSFGLLKECTSQRRKTANTATPSAMARYIGSNGSASGKIVCGAVYVAGAVGVSVAEEWAEV